MPAEPEVLTEHLHEHVHEEAELARERWVLGVAGIVCLIQGLLQ